VDDVPADHPLLNVKKLEDEGCQAFNSILAYQSSAHISRSTLHLLRVLVLFSHAIYCLYVFYDRISYLYESVFCCHHQIHHFITVHIF